MREGNYPAGAAYDSNAPYNACDNCMKDVVIDEVIYDFKICDIVGKTDCYDSDNEFTGEFNDLHFYTPDMMIADLLKYLREDMRKTTSEARKAKIMQKLETIHGVKIDYVDHTVGVIQDEFPFED